MKSLKELQKIREKAAKRMNVRNEKDGYRVVVGMATCGITAGARPVMNRLVELVENKELNNVKVTQVGCMGECALEPIVEVYSPDGIRTTYCKVDPKKAEEIVNTHLIEGKIVEKYKIENFRK